MFALNKFNQPFEIINSLDSSQLIDTKLFETYEALCEAYRENDTTGNIQDRLLTVEDCSDRLGYCLTIHDNKGNSGDIENQSLIEFIESTNE